jgi:hypothetical protein
MQLVSATVTNVLVLKNASYGVLCSDVFLAGDLSVPFRVCFFPQTQHPETHFRQCQAKLKFFLFFIPLKGVLKRVTEIQE